MAFTTEYNGYFIEECLDGTYDVMTPQGALAESDFKTKNEAKKYIDGA